MEKMDFSEYWKTIFETLPDGLLIVDPEGVIMAVNPAAETLTGYSAGNWSAATVGSWTAPDVIFTGRVRVKNGANSFRTAL